ncbi:flagellar export chaperone FlgN [Sporichthya polymorpha]|uniref:flagellar export chaperone FlgN n=1 Tax=Sporichthya polymorpha TaxID=35751 RepID=UPI0003702B08|nr:flagellar export chaperone FlgN [Sporichthya polymorpha]
MGLAEVSTILWRERELLELLLFKLEEEQLVLTSGRSRWLARATKEVEIVLAEIRRTELARATAVDEAAEALGLAPNPSLAALADACAEPWAGILRDHRTSFHALTAEITALANSNRDLITAGKQATEETIRMLMALNSKGDDVPTYSPSGAASASVPRARLINEAL